MPILDINCDSIDKQLKHLLTDNKFTNDLNIKDISLKYVNKGFVKQLICDSNEKTDKTLHSIEVIEGNTDLIVNSYEGGFKLWEGLYDLLEYFQCFQTLSQYSNHQNLNVLELGCGSGLVSVYVSKKLINAKLFVQDFNEDVIRYFTAINVVLNANSNPDLISRFNYMSGDWTSTVEDIQSSGLKFDLIFTTETLYNCENYQKLVDVFKTALSSKGTVYIGSKAHYFGVGGGTYSFMDFVESDGHFNCEITHEIEAPLIRHIIKLWTKDTEN